MNFPSLSKKQRHNNLKYSPHIVGVKEEIKMSDLNAHNLKIKIETEEYIYWEYIEA